MVGGRAGAEPAATASRVEYAMIYETCGHNQEIHIKQETQPAKPHGFHNRGARIQERRSRGTLERKRLRCDNQEGRDTAQR